MKSPDVKRSIVVAGHKTRVSVGEAFSSGMKEISGARSEIDANRNQRSVICDPPVRARPLQEPCRSTDWRAQAAR
jgi:hypothetical protein